MAEKKQSEEHPAAIEEPLASPEDQAKARKWFERAQTVAQTRNYDYAIECYLRGLEFWPEAVEEGHKPLRAAALARRQSGGKKPGMMEAMKHSMSGRDPKKAMLNAELLLAKDPTNISYMEGVFRNASKAHYDRTAMWIGQILFDAVKHEKKPSRSRLELLKQVYEQIGDRAQERGDYPTAVEAYERGVAALDLLRQLRPQDLDVSNQQRDLSSKLTILKGHYGAAESFKDSLRDAEVQKELATKERLVQTDTQLDQLIAKARADVAANPDVPTKITALVELLCKRERPQEEQEAIDILTQAYERTKNYRFKMLADDIRIRQWSRRAREILARGDRRAAQEHLAKQLAFEVEIFRERAENYPTDMRIRYQYGLRLFKARRYDEAVPVFQAARADPKHRVLCNAHIGRCFFEKGYYAQAIDVFRQALEEYEIEGDELSKEMTYWLARSCESDGRTEDATRLYGQLLQWDYNYRDVRARLDQLRKGS